MRYFRLKNIADINQDTGFSGEQRPSLFDIGMQQGGPEMRREPLVQEPSSVLERIGRQEVGKMMRRLDARLMRRE